jgi:type I restriction enzyme R subunit
MKLHKEINFENDICAHLAANGWLYDEGDASKYDRALALYPDDVLAWVQGTQAEAWEALVKNHGSNAGPTLLGRIRDQINQRGTLDVLRNGVEMIGVRGGIKLAEFKPALAINEDILARYSANRLRVVRQVKYSTQNENCLDLVLFLNGVAVATAELKTDFTQSIEDAVYQYRKDRDPKPKGMPPEPLLSFVSGAIVHFAVSNSEVRLTTELKGSSTFFLPFNLGRDGGAGNPLNPSGHQTSYLWEDVWQRDSLLEILGRYIIAQRNKAQVIEKIIFPRFHQLAVTRMLQAAVLKEGAGSKYLVQHSAGSGKTNSIAWTAHFLSELHDASSKKIFDTVLVVSDRNVIDAQLQDALFDFQRTTGVVAKITSEAGSKSGALAEALSGSKKIVVCTIQTFPFAIDAVRKLAATGGKKFAVIADEAHSSQTGEAASNLRAVLSPEEIEQLGDGADVSTEDILLAQMSARASDSGITFVAFTATPKAKTLELFGRRPKPKEPASAANLPQPFHVYSMRQAIEEGFILDVLKNYTPYKLAFKLAHNGADYDDKTVERSTALKGIMQWVRLHPYNISQKVQVVVEHYRHYVSPLLREKAKAMVVVASRLEAVRWKIAIEKYILSRGYPIGTVVAFSGEVNDKESGSDPFTENSASLNPKLKGRDIREAFKADDYKILLVANKFQTGFDQPLLCGMYVDKRLAGIQAVQTLSRLNRAHPGKDTTYILDFVNDPEEILTAFKAYHTTAELESATDPNVVYNLRAKLDALGYYDSNEVGRVVDTNFDPQATQKDLQAVIAPVADRLVRRYAFAQQSFRSHTSAGNESKAKEAEDEMTALRLFRTDIGSYVRVYTFLSQMFDYANTDLEKRSIFFRVLLPLLEFGREREGIDLSKVQMTHHQLKNLGPRNFVLNEGEADKLAPVSATGSGKVQEKQRARLREIIEKVNEIFEGDFTSDETKLVYIQDVIKGKLTESDVLQQQASSNTKEQFGTSPDLQKALLNAIMDTLDAHQNMSAKALNSESTRKSILEFLLNYCGLYESLREKKAG